MNESTRIQKLPADDRVRGGDRQFRTIIQCSIHRLICGTPGIYVMTTNSAAVSYMCMQQICRVATRMHVCILQMFSCVMSSISAQRYTSVEMQLHGFACTCIIERLARVHCYCRLFTCMYVALIRDAVAMQRCFTFISSLLLQFIGYFELYAYFRVTARSAFITELHLFMSVQVTLQYSSAVYLNCYCYVLFSAL